MGHGDHGAYVHGYADREASRLSDQANALARLLHHDTHYAPGSKVLEAGCGVGSQTVHLAIGGTSTWGWAVIRSETVQVLSPFTMPELCSK